MCKQITQNHIELIFKWYSQHKILISIFWKLNQQASNAHKQLMMQLLSIIKYLAFRRFSQTNWGKKHGMLRPYSSFTTSASMLKYRTIVNIEYRACCLNSSVWENVHAMSRCLKHIVGWMHFNVYEYAQIIKVTYNAARVKG